MKSEQDGLLRPPVNPKTYTIETIRYGRVSSNMPIQYDGDDTFSIDLRDEREVAK